MKRKEWEFVERRLLIDELASKLFKWNIYLNDNKKTWKILFTESENSCYILCCKLLFMLDVMSIIKNQFVVKTKEEKKLNKFMIIVHRWHFWMFVIFYDLLGRQRYTMDVFVMTIIYMGNINKLPIAFIDV